MIEPGNSDQLLRSRLQHTGMSGGVVCGGCGRHTPLCCCPLKQKPELLIPVTRLALVDSCHAPTNSAGVKYLPLQGRARRLVACCSAKRFVIVPGNSDQLLRSRLQHTGISGGVVCGGCCRHTPLCCCPLKQKPELLIPVTRLALVDSCHAPTNSAPKRIEYPLHFIGVR